MIADLMDILFGCWHSNYSFPLTAKTGNRAAAAQATGTYVVCLDCGKEFPYDWQDMKVITSVAATSHRVHALAPKEAA